MTNIASTRFIAVFLLSGLIGTAYGSVQHSVGVARGQDDSVSYIEHHQYLESGEHVIRYYDSELQLLLSKELSYPNLPQHPTLKQTDLVKETEVSIETDDKAAVMTRRSRDEGDVFEFELTEDVIIDAGFDAYVRENWNRFDANPVQEFRFAIAGQSRLIDMEIRRVEASQDGASFTITPRNWFIRLILPTTRLEYDAERKLSEYEGFSNLKQANESRNVQISFKHYQMDTSLPEPLTEWLPVEVAKL